ncbi:hypothetical protein O3P69_019173 [Scylla paramamosain]|uniref:Aminoacyl-tRNA synthetase class Ia domain-containing protein n=1 Tax=Scylla paramamosain TaxID=85552 RepID=A0AAW0SVQ1_SCYPA
MSSPHDSIPCIRPPPGVSLQSDILMRPSRKAQMQGGEAVFIPGAHHTGSATQMVVERHLWDAQGNTKHDLDRQKSLLMKCGRRGERNNDIRPAAASGGFT